MATVTYNVPAGAITYNDIALLKLVSAQIVTVSATTFHVRTTVTGAISGTLDTTMTGNFDLLGGAPVGGVITGLRADFNGQTLLDLSNFSLPYGNLGQAADLDGLMALILTGNDSVVGANVAEILQGFTGVDNIFGGGGIDFINGNQGDDTVNGGDGFDIVRGGRDNDLILGEAGDDWLSGDRGSDTLTGGLGADIFHTFSQAGLDRVTDFNRAQGDRVMVDPGTQYTVAQSGADVVIDMGGGNQMVLAGVQMSALTGDWIFGA